MSNTRTTGPGSNAPPKGPASSFAEWRRAAGPCALFGRIEALLQADLCGLVNRSENPDALLKELQLDIRNQFVQAKTQLALTLAEHGQLEKRQQAILEEQRDWVRRAQQALEQDEDGLARVALERFLLHESAAANLADQIQRQAIHAKLLREALYRLQEKQSASEASANSTGSLPRRKRLAERQTSPSAPDMDVSRRYDEQVERLLEHLRSRLNSEPRASAS